MSLNEVHYNGADSGQVPFIDLNVTDLTIEGRMLRNKSGSNKNGYVLQCYADGRATFSAPPRFNRFQYALVGVNPTSDDFPFTNFSFSLTAECIDTDGLIESDGEKITIKKDGIYLVIYKICRFNSACTVFSQLLSSSTNFISPGSASISPSIVEDSSCYHANIMALAEDTEIELTRDILGPEDIPPQLVLEPNTVIAERQALISPSYVMFLKIGA